MHRNREKLFDKGQENDMRFSEGKRESIHAQSLVGINKKRHAYHRSYRALSRRSLSFTLLRAEPCRQHLEVSSERMGGGRRQGARVPDRSFGELRSHTPSVLQVQALPLRPGV